MFKMFGQIWNTYLVKHDSVTRQIIWAVPLNSGFSRLGNAGELFYLNNGNLIYIPKHSNFNSFIIDPYDGSVINEVKLETEQFIEIKQVFDEADHFMCAGVSRGRDNITFFKLDQNLNLFDISVNYLPLGISERCFKINKRDEGGYIGLLANDKTPYSYVFSSDSNGIIFSNQIRGKAVGDLNSDCTFDSLDVILENWEIRANNDDFVFYTETDEDGNYNLQVNSSQYEISIVPKNDYWLNCDTVDIEFTNFFDTLSNVNLTTSAITPCSFIEVDVGFGFLRRCFSNKVKVQYCNQGTFAEDSTMIELNIDSYLDLDTTSIPIASQEDTTFFFDIGNVGIGECGSFSINVTPNCDNTILGQEHCINAHVYPDTLCVPQDSLWSGANVVVEAICLGDSTLFNLINNGNAATKDDLVYIVIVDDIIVSRTDNYSLAAGESIQFVEYEPGSTIQVIAEQEPFHPLGNQVGAEAFCTGTDFDFISEFNQYDDDPFTDLVCVNNIGSFDPNDKSALPIGDGPEHLISSGQDLEYKIRFQNTGTDTAFTVVIRDTISDVLDMSTFEAGISSHDYILDIEDNNILVFTFNNILLPDSTVNWTASNGFVEFKINQIENNLPGTIIENTAAIYFDFNEPVITNTVFHTIETPLVFSILDVQICANDPYNTVYYEEDVTLSEFFYTDIQDSISIVNLYLLPIDSTIEFYTVPYGEPFNDITLTSDTTIIETYSNSIGCDSMVVKNIMVEQPNAVALLDESHWSIFPNPAKDFLSISTNHSFADNNYSVRLMSILGKTLYENNHEIAPSTDTRLSLKDIPPGTYFLVIHSEHGTITKKVIVQQ